MVLAAASAEEPRKTCMGRRPRGRAPHRCVDTWQERGSSAAARRFPRGSGRRGRGSGGRRSCGIDPPALARGLERRLPMPGLHAAPRRGRTPSTMTHFMDGAPSLTRAPGGREPGAVGGDGDRRIGARDGVVRESFKPWPVSVQTTHVPAFNRPVWARRSVPATADRRRGLGEDPLAPCEQPIRGQDAVVVDASITPPDSSRAPIAPRQLAGLRCGSRWRRCAARPPRRRARAEPRRRPGSPSCGRGPDDRRRHGTRDSPSGRR